MDQITPLSEANQSRETQRWRLAFAGMVLAMLIFGSNFVVSRHAVLNGLTSHDLLALRFGIAGLLLLPSFLAGGFATCGGVGWGRGILLAIMSGFPMSFLLLTGVTYAPAAHGATIGPGLVTVISIIGSVALFGALITRQLVFGIAAVLAGLVSLGIAGTTHTNPAILFGDLCFVGVGLIWGMYPLLVQLWRLDALKVTSVVAFAPNIATTTSPSTTAGMDSMRSMRRASPRPTHARRPRDDSLIPITRPKVIPMTVANRAVSRAIGRST